MSADKNALPYISILVAVRCDGWGGESLYERYQSFINYLYSCRSQNPNLFELCIAEYNPVNNKPVFREKIKIPDSMDFKLWFVPKEVHLSIEPNREFYATYPLNFLMRHAKGRFLLPTTQDVFFSKTLDRKIEKKITFLEKFFYRVDRLDFENINRKNFCQLSAHEQTRIA